MAKNNVWSGEEPIATNRKDEQIRFRMRRRDVVVKQVELSWGGTNHDELQGHTTTHKTELLAMHNDAVRQKNGWSRYATGAQRTATNRHDLERYRTMQNELKRHEKKAVVIRYHISIMIKGWWYLAKMLQGNREKLRKMKTDSVVYV